MIRLNDLKPFLDKKETEKQLTRLYGGEMNAINAQKIRYLELADLFRALFPSSSGVRIFSTSGRTEVAGNHTDHQRGHVLCGSVDLDIIAMVSPNNDNVIRLKSKEYDKMDVIDLSDLAVQPSEHLHSSSLIRGIASGFFNRGYHIGGFDAYTSSHVPKGSGLSSSAAFEIMVATILNFIYNGGQIPPVAMALISQYAENNYFGKPCGLMDQCGCSVGGLMTIDFKTPGMPVVDAIPVDFDDYGYSLVISNTGGSHAGLNDDYASIPADMKKAAGYFGKDVLREVPRNLFMASVHSLRDSVGDKAILRAMHFYADDERVILQAAALKEKKIDTFLDLVNESGISSWTLLQNIYSLKRPDEQPVALGLALSNSILGGRGACRVHGGGFAGTIQAFVPHDLVSEYINKMESVFGKKSSWKLRIRNVPTAELIDR